MIRFKHKEFSNNYIVSDAIKGAGYGATIGALATGNGVLVPKSIPKFIPGASKYEKLRNDKTVKFTPKGSGTPEESTKVDQEGRIKQQLALMGASVIIGATLGALVGAVKQADRYISHKNADQRLLGEVLKDLGKKGWKEGVNFTRDPKQANELRTKVCLVVTRDGANLKVLVNIIDDPKLKTAADRVVKGLTGPTQVRNSVASNKYNEITISTISKTPSNVKTVSELASSFIKAGYPVYIVEVG